MKISIFFFFLVYYSLFSQFDKSINIEKPNKVVALFKERFKSYKTYETNFKEVNRNHLKIGKIFFKQPNLIRIKYFQGGNVITDIFSDSKKLYIHFLKEKILFEQDLSRKKDRITSSQNLNALFLIKNYNFNFAKTQDLIEVLNEDEKKKFLIFQNKNRNLAYHLRLSPKNIEKGLNNLQLWLSTKGDIIRVKSRNINNQIVDFYFFETRINQGNIPENFNFIVPSQVRIVKNVLPND